MRVPTTRPAAMKVPRRAVKAVVACASVGALVVGLAGVAGAAAARKPHRGGPLTVQYGSSSISYVTNSWSTGGGGKIIWTTCPNLNPSVGRLTSMTFSATADATGLAGQRLLAFVSGPAYVTSVGGSSGSSGYTGAGGNALVNVVPYAAGTVTVRGVWDFNGNGVWDPAIEPSTEPRCTMNAR